jgi:glyoxylase-like metal-dependent hydrolase (beta-lactamase superfamily II)
MQEITPDIFIETNYLGVNLGVINAPHGLILIDAPLRPEDNRSWRSALLNLGGGVDRMLINLDAHPDRTLGSRAMECTVVGHEKIAQAFRNRPTTFKSQNSETGADWEQIPSLGTIRWNPPEISFSEEMEIHWGSDPILLEYRPGPNAGAIWIHIPDEEVLFIGDAVLKDQPPFLSHAELPAWINNLKDLQSPEYRDYFLVSGRTGLITQEDIRKQVQYLEKAQGIINQLCEQKMQSELVEKAIPELLAPFHVQPQRLIQYTHRIRWGLTHYHNPEVQVITPEMEE